MSGGTVGAAGADDPDRRDHVRIKKQGIALATAGLLMALGILQIQESIGVLEIPGPGLLEAAAITLAAQGALWLVPHLGWDEHLRWDEHYVLLPVGVASLLLGYYTWLAPEADHLLLLGWFVALVFMAGLAGLRDVVALALVMAGANLAALELATESVRPGTLDLVQAGVFLAVNVYAGVVFEHLRDEREERKELRSRLADQARTDHLTGLPNRRAFDQELRAEMNRVERYDARGALVLLDLDHFKVYNDAHGHPTGDEALKAVAAVLQRESRASDTVARYGGEEFAVVMPELSPGEAREAADRLRAVVEEHEVDGEEVLPTGRLTASLGVAAYPEDGASFADVLRVADRRLYRAKDLGRNRVCAAEG